MAIYVRDENGVLQAWEIPAYKGEKGEAGITPNLKIGDVITLESGQQATITRRGDDENPIFDFAIPKGENGEDGIFVGRIEDAPSHAQIVVNDDPSPYDLFYENANVSYMGDTYTSLKEKADADIEYLLRKFGTQHHEGTSITATDTYAKQVNHVLLKGVTKYRDKITGEIIDTFQEGRNLELVSVKSPTVTTANKNLFDFNDLELGAINSSTGNTVSSNNTRRTKNFINVSFINKFTFSMPGYKKTDGARYVVIYCYDKNEKILGFTPLGDNLATYQNRPFLENTYFIKVSIQQANPSDVFEVQLEHGSVATSYEPPKSHTLTTPSGLTLRGIGNVQDTLDLNTGEYIKRTETRPYQQGDETNAEVLTDKVNTVYKLAQPTTTKIDLKGQKVYSYDGTTHYTTSSLDGYPAPILSIDVPINVTTIIAGQQEKLKQQEQKLQEQEEIQNLLIESQLAWFEDNISTLELTDEDTPSHIQKLYELTRKYKVEEE